MTGWRKRQVLEMAREVKMPYNFVTGEPINLERLEAFAELVREDEREACAKLCETIGNTQAKMNAAWRNGCRDAAIEIRARDKHD